MLHLNQTLFLLLNAAQDASPVVVGAAWFLADGLIWIVPTGLMLGWLKGSSMTRQVLIAATVSGLTGLLINQLLGLIWYQTVFAGLIRRGWVRQ
jgi:undecaprenyl-diphosphatase